MDVAPTCTTAVTQIGGVRGFSFAREFMQFDLQAKYILRQASRPVALNRDGSGGGLRYPLETVLFPDNAASVLPPAPDRANSPAKYVYTVVNYSPTVVCCLVCLHHFSIF